MLTLTGGAPPAGAVHPALPDRIEIGTIACVAAITHGEMFREHARIELLGVAAPLLAAAGVMLEEPAPD